MHRMQSTEPSPVTWMCKLCGVTPSRRLLSRKSSSRFERDPIESGIAPENELPERLSRLSSVNLESESGVDPKKSAWSRVSSVSRLVDDELSTGSQRKPQVNKTVEEVVAGVEGEVLGADAPAGTH
ncbi:hypothetical protein ACFX13_016315 [Malus domestica]